MGGGVLVRESGAALVGLLGVVEAGGALGPVPVAGLLPVTNLGKQLLIILVNQ